MSTLNYSGSLIWSKCFLFALLLCLIIYYRNPADLCFPIEIEEVYGDPIVQNNTIFERSDNSYRKPGYYCVNLNVTKHIRCESLHLSTNPDDLCLGIDWPYVVVTANLMVTLIIDFMQFAMMAWRKLKWIYALTAVFQVLFLASGSFYTLEMYNQWYSNWAMFVVQPTPIYAEWQMYAIFLVAAWKFAEITLIFSNPKSDPAILPQRAESGVKFD